MLTYLIKFSSLSVLSFITSNILFYFFEKLYDPVIGSILTIAIIFNFNIFLLFKLKLFSKNIKNYFKLLTFSFFFRVNELAIFNILYFFIFKDLASNLIFLISLLISFLIKMVFYYKFSDMKHLS